MKNRTPAKSFSSLIACMAFFLVSCVALPSAHAQTATVSSSAVSISSGVAFSANIPSTSSNLLYTSGSLTAASSAPLSGSWSVLTDGAGYNYSDSSTVAQIGNNVTLTYTLNTTQASDDAGYNVTAIDVFTGWPNNGRFEPNFSILYSTISAPTTFLSLAGSGVNNPFAYTYNASWVQLNISGLSSVAAIKFSFGSQENNGVGYAELAVLGTGTSLGPLITWTGAANGTWDSSTTNWVVTGTSTPSAFSDKSAVTFDSTGANRNITVSGTSAGSSVKSGPINFTNDAAHSYTFSGGAIDTTGVGTAGNLSVSGGGSVTFNNSLNLGIGNITLSNGILVLNAANTIAGSTTVTSGTLQIGNNTALGSSALVVNGGMVDFSPDPGSILTVNSLAGSGGRVLIGSLQSLGIGGTTSTAYAGTIAQAPGTTGGSLYKQGTGTLTLSGTSAYDGGTEISAGKLLVTNNIGSATGPGNVIIDSGAALGGSGIITGLVTTTGGTLAPNVSGSVTSTLTLSGGLNATSAVFSFNFGAANASDKIITTNLTLGGTETLNVSFINGLQSGTYELLHYTGSLSGGSTPFTISGTPAVAYTLLVPGATGNPFAGSFALSTTILSSTWTSATNGTWDTATSNWSGPGGAKYIDGQPVVFGDTASSGAVSVQAAGVNPTSVTFNNNTKNYTLTNASGAVGIAGAAFVNISGSGNVTFSSQNTYTGGTFLNSGTLSITNDNQLGNAPASPANNLTFNGGILAVGNGVSLSGNRNLLLTGNGTIYVGTGTATLNGLFSGTGTFIKDGPGTLSMNATQNNAVPTTANSNSNTGGITINSGTLSFTNFQNGQTVTSGTIVASPLGAGPLTMNNGSAIKFNNWYGAITFSNALNFSGTVTFLASQNGETFDPSPVTVAPVATLLSDVYLTMASGYSNVASNGLILLEKLTGAHQLTVANGVAPNTSYLTLGNASNNYSGGTVVNGGDVHISNGISSVVSGGVVVSGPLGTGTVTFHAGSNFAAGNSTERISNSIVIDGNMSMGTDHSYLQFDPQGANSTFTLANTPALTVNNSYGSFYIKNYQLLGTGFSVTTQGTGDAGLVVYSQNISQNAMTTGVTVNSGILTYDVGTATSGNFQFGPSITLATGSANFIFNINSGMANFTTPITGSGFLTKTGGGGMALSGTNSYSGGGAVNGGILTFLNTNAKPATGTVTVSAGATLGLGVGGAGYFSSANLDSLFAGTMTNVTNNATSNVGIDTTAGDFSYASNVTGTRGLTKLGANTLTITGQTSYTGPTTVNAGKLVVSGSISGSATTVNGDANTTLAGNGLITSNVTITLGRIAPGNNVSGVNNNFGTADTIRLGTNGGLTLTNAKLDLDLSGTGTAAGGVNDKIAAGGVLSLSSNVVFTFNLLNGSLDTTNAYTLISGASSVTGFNATTLAANTLGLAGGYTPTYSVSGNNLLVQFAAIPEPQTWLMLISGVGMLTLLRRRRV